MKNFVMDKAVLSEEERQEILAALQSINISQNGGSQTLQKLSAIIDVSSESWLDFCYRSEHRLTYFHLFL